MTRILVLGSGRLAKSASEKYRGTYRSHPDYQSHLGAGHEVNKAFDAFCEQGGQSLAISDIAFARHIASVYHNLQTPQIFDLVEVVGVNETPKHSDKFLGYDISVGTGHSILCDGINIRNHISGKAIKAEPLFHLLEDYFKPKLNHVGLFDDLKTARFFLQSCACLNDFVPSFFWSKNDVYEVISLYIIN